MGVLSTTIQLNDRVSSVLDNMIRGTNDMMNAFSTLNNTEFDPQIFTSAREEMARAEADVNRLSEMLRDVSSQSRTNISFGTDIDTTVFNTSGLTRYQQELQDASRLVNILQENMNSMDTTGEFFSDSARADLVTVQNRIAAIRNQIANLQSNPDMLHVAQDNAELEQLRSQLAQCINAQSSLNSAMRSGNASQAVSSFNTLRNSVRGVETNIRSNIDRQNQFTNSVNNSTTATESLRGVITKITSIYASIKGGQKVLNVSDDYSNLKARLGMIADEGQTVTDMLNNLYAISADSRSDLFTNGDAVYGFATSAKDAFDTTKQVYSFVDLINKSLTTAGAGTTEIQSTLLQLKQGLGSGKLQGDEFRSLSENAPQILQYVADSLGKTRAEVKQMSTDGKITADVIKGAIFKNADDINSKFEKMPKTFGQIWIEFKNNAIKQFAPVLDKLNDVANNEEVQRGINYIISGFGAIAQAGVVAFEEFSKLAGAIGDNWDAVQPILIGLVGAKGLLSGIIMLEQAQMQQATLTAAAEMGAISTSNAALVGNMALWSAKIALVAAGILLLIGIFAGGVAIFNQVTGKHVSALGVLVGAFYWVKAEASNLVNSGIGFVNGMTMAIMACEENAVRVVKNGKNDILVVFNEIAAGAAEIVNDIVGIFNKIPGVNIDTGKIEYDRDEWKRAADYYKDTKQDYLDIGDAFSYGKSTYDYKKVDASQEYQKGYDKVAEWKKSLTDLGNGEDYSDILSELNNIANSSANTAGNTNDTKKAINKSLEKTDVKYLGDLFKSFADKNRTNVYVQQGIEVRGDKNDYTGITEQLGRNIKRSVKKVLG